jgi:CRISPR-associated endonuclease Csy4
MKFYKEIKLLPDPEFKETLLMNILFSRLHVVLADKGNGEVGISFPHFDKTLGNVIRLHGTSEALERIQSLRWLKGLNDYINEKDILQVPENCQYRVVKRAQTKSSVERLYRRSVKKGWLTEAEAEIEIQKKKDKKLKHPFVQVKSQSTGKQFPLFIMHEEIMDTPQNGKFSAYGLSTSNATIPWF